MKKFIGAALLALAAGAHATATYSFEYVGQKQESYYAETTGKGTFTVANADLSTPQPILSITGTFNDPIDLIFGVKDIPIDGLAPLNTVPHFNYDNLIGDSGNGLLVSNAGFLFVGRRDPTNPYFPGDVAYTNIYADVSQYTGKIEYFADTYLAPFANLPGADYVAPVDFTVSLLSQTAPVPEPLNVAMFGGALLLFARRKISV